MEIDWAKESPKVKESLDLVKASHKIYKSLSQGEKERFDYLLELIVEEQGGNQEDAPEI